MCNSGAANLGDTNSTNPVNGNANVPPSRTVGGGIIALIASLVAVNLAIALA